MELDPTLPDGLVLLRACSQEEALACLTPVEAAEQAALPSEKRRGDWLLGRVAAKAAVRRLLAEEGRVVPDWRDLSLPAGPAGEPRVLLPGGPSDLAVSLSHGHGLALAWARRSGPAGGLPGVDLERVRSRPEGTLRFYLHPDERAPVLQLPAGAGEAPGPRDHLAILLWALKEAAFKALVPPRGLGLLDVRVRLEGGWEAQEGTSRVELREGLAARARALGVAEVRARWRREGELVLAWVEARGAALP